MVVTATAREDHLFCVFTEASAVAVCSSDRPYVSRLSYMFLYQVLTFRVLVADTLFQDVKLRYFAEVASVCIAKLYLYCIPRCFVCTLLFANGDEESIT